MLFGVVAQLGQYMLLCPVLRVRQYGIITLALNCFEK